MPIKTTAKAAAEIVVARHKPVKVTMKQVLQSMARYTSGCTGQRFGQFLMSELMPSESCPEVFYETDDTKAMDEFVERFVEKDEAL